MRIQSVCLGVLAAGVPLLAACLGDGTPSKITEPAETASMSLMGGGRAIEEEIFGVVTTTDSTGWKAFLSPSNNLPTGASDSVSVFGDHGSGQD
ncbi:MAG: hypothetical protein OER90_14675 [Gemmatimonadota bacterium]|nr:hypothetical protein [Gemmatimonadota bacterium]